MVDPTNVSRSFIEINGLFGYLRQQPDDFVETILERALVAASVNRNLFNIAEGISEDCQKTAKAMANMYEELPLVIEVDKLIHRCSQQTALSLKKSLSFSNPAELICKHIETELETFLVLYPEFQYLKKVAQLDISGRPYYLEMPKSVEKATELFLREVIDLQVARIVTIGVFVYHVEARNDSNAGYVKVAQAIHTLSKRRDLIRPTQQLFTKTVTEISTKAIVEIQKETHKTKSSRQFNLFFANLYKSQTMECLDQAFISDSMLKDEYKKARDESLKKLEAHML